MIVDDGRPALERFTRLIGEDKRITVKGAFSSPSEALKFVRQNKIDFAFLDIEMPGIGGLELSRYFHEHDPDIKIIFVTAYDSYALDAIKLHAAEYLLKPIDRGELAEQIDFLLKDTEQNVGSSKLKVRCFGDF